VYEPHQPAKPSALDELQQVLIEVAVLVVKGKKQEALARLKEGESLVQKLRDKDLDSV
jgi:hypothetical protein